MKINGKTKLSQALQLVEATAKRNNLNLTDTKDFKYAIALYNEKQK